jgi:hypothetical protein
MAFGIFAAVSPASAAKIWGSQKLAKLAPKDLPLFLRLYRVFGILLFLAGVLIAIERLAFSNYHR